VSASFTMMGRGRGLARRRETGRNPLHARRRARRTRRGCFRPPGSSLVTCPARSCSPSPVEAAGCRTTAHMPPFAGRVNGAGDGMSPSRSVRWPRPPRGMGMYGYASHAYSGFRYEPLWYIYTDTLSDGYVALSGTRG